MKITANTLKIILEKNGINKDTTNNIIQDIENNEKELENSLIQESNQREVHLVHTEPLTESVFDFAYDIVDDQRERFVEHFNYDDIPDEGSDFIDHYMINGKLYECTIHCDAEWHGDWSLKCNLPDDIYLTKVEEIKEFKIVNDSKENRIIEIL